MLSTAVNFQAKGRLFTIHSRTVNGPMHGPMVFHIYARFRAIHHQFKKAASCFKLQVSIKALCNSCTNWDTYTCIKNRKTGKTE